jgi:pyrroloquinoline quinone biosynthesis protein D
VTTSIPAHVRPVMATLFRLRFEPDQDSWVLLHPEGRIKLNTPAAEILRRCDGAHSVDQIVADLEFRFAELALRDDVCAFLAQARQHGWLQQLLDMPAGNDPTC